MTETPILPKAPVRLNEQTAVTTADHFYTISLDERDNAIATFGYHGEGVAGYLSSVSPSGLSAFYRLEGGQVGDHFYTTSLDERDNAFTTLGYHSEQIACYVYPVPATGTVALHRLASSTHHFYTTSDSERDNAMANLGFHSEGEAGYVLSAPAPGTTPLFRLVSPQQGDHFYTISADERDNAIATSGYQDEGIACHVFGFRPVRTQPAIQAALLAKTGGQRVSSHLLPAVNGFAFDNNWQFDDFEKERVQEVLAVALVTATTSLAPLLVPAVAPAIGIVDALGLLFGIPPGSIEIAAGAIAIDKIKDLIDTKLSEGYGLCGGMAWASLDYYLTGLQIPRQFTTPPVRPGGAVLRDYIWTRLLDTMIEGVAITTIEWIAILKFDALGGAGELLKRTINEWQTLKTRVDMGFPVPIALIGTTANPMEDHQVLAYGYEDNGDNTGKLYIYDNNHHDQEATWLLNFTGPALIADEGISKNDKRGPLQGFFCSNYTLNPHPPVIPTPEVAFQANTGNLWTVGPDGAKDRGLGMMAGTSPSIAGPA